jgi:hypothetical protein
MAGSHARFLDMGLCSQTRAYILTPGEAWMPFSRALHPVHVSSLCSLYKRVSERPELEFLDALWVGARRAGCSFELADVLMCWMC